MINATNKSKPKEPIPAGTYLARCYSIAHIGTEYFEYQGEAKESNKVRLTFELPKKLKVFDEKKGLEPMVIGEEYGISTHKKSNLRAVMNSWRGFDFTADEEKNFDVLSMIGEPCMIGISITDKDYNKITSISKMMDGMECPAQMNKTALFDYNENFGGLSALPEFIQKKIRETPEYKVKMGLAVDTENQSLEQMSQAGADEDYNQATGADDEGFAKSME